VLGVLLGLIFVEQRHDLAHHDVHWIIAHFLDDRHQAGAILRQLADVELQLEVITEEARVAWTTTTSNGAGFAVPASIICWNSGRRSLVADAPASTNVSTSWYHARRNKLRPACVDPG
jgi:hypothetical protein